MRRKIVAPLAIAGVLALGAGCSSATSRHLNPDDPTATLGLAEVPNKSSDSGAVPLWPTPEDCIAYHPSAVTMRYEVGVFTVNDGATEVLRVHGAAGSEVGKQGLALVQRFGRHCFVGRANTRTENPEAYVFDYWRDPSGRTPTIPAESCSKYNKNTLDIEDAGGGKGWLVKDHDQVLALFDGQPDARNGKLVLSKYTQICAIGDKATNDQVTYFK